MYDVMLRVTWGPWPVAHALPNNPSEKGKKEYSNSLKQKDNKMRKGQMSPVTITFAHGNQIGPIHGGDSPYILIIHSR